MKSNNQPKNDSLIVSSDGTDRLTRLVERKDQRLNSIPTEGLDFRMPESRSSATLISLISGAIAGQSVDLVLFPLDTIKTRLQSEVGFWKAGGFARIYSGLSSTLIGAAPNAAIFFATYESAKTALSRVGLGSDLPLNHAIAASVGEVAACLVRVPVENVKQNAQASQITSRTALKSILTSRKGPLGLYRGYLTTTLREIPFSLIQFPLWEFLKLKSNYHFPDSNQVVRSTLCGALAGGLAAGLTTPLDVAKTRIMLAKEGSKESSGQVLVVLCRIHQSSGIKGLFAGLAPRVVWISLGGAIFLGGYDLSSQILRDHVFK